MGVGRIAWLFSDPNVTSNSRPIAYSQAPKGPAVAVQAGGPAVKVTFDDSQPWNK